MPEWLRHLLDSDEYICGITTNIYYPYGGLREYRVVSTLDENKRISLYFFENGQLSVVTLKKSKQLYSKTTPAQAGWNKLGKPKYEFYYRNLAHRENGPAIIFYSKGIVHNVFYYIYGKEHSRAHYLKKYPYDAWRELMALS